MRGRDEIDVVATLLLQPQQAFGQLRRAGLGRKILLADVIILAEDATQVALSEEHCPAAIPTPQAIFFSVVRKRAAYARISPHAAGPKVAC